LGRVSPSVLLAVELHTRGGSGRPHAVAYAVRTPAQPGLILKNIARRTRADGAGLRNESWSPPNFRKIEGDKLTGGNVERLLTDLPRTTPGGTLTSPVWVKRGAKWLVQLHTETFPARKRVSICAISLDRSLSTSRLWSRVVVRYALVSDFLTTPWARAAGWKMRTGTLVDLRRVEK
jgi:hypothetical protein